MNGWPMVPLGEVLQEERRRISTVNGDDLPLLGVSNAEGLHRSGLTRISDMSRYFRVERRWFAYNPMRINVGSIGWAKSEYQMGIISPDYVVFSCTEKVLPELVYWFLKHRRGLQAINSETAGSVRERLYFESLARIGIPLPPIGEQWRLVERIDTLAAKIEEAKQLRSETFRSGRSLLLSAFRSTIDGVPTRPMAEIAPLVRRPVQPKLGELYYELGVRSFGKGTFHKPALEGEAVGTKKLYAIQPGDVVFSNVFAWEGAVAVAKPEDAGRVGSHRFITCVPKPDVATAEFINFHFSTARGLQQIGEASPGGAGRNRTLGLEALSRIEVPIPEHSSQIWFGQLLAMAEETSARRNVADQELNAMLPAILDRAFRGEL